MKPVFKHSPVISGSRPEGVIDTHIVSFLVQLVLHNVVVL